MCCHVPFFLFLTCISICFCIFSCPLTARLWSTQLLIISFPLMILALFSPITWWCLLHLQFSFFLLPILACQTSTHWKSGTLCSYIYKNKEWFCQCSEAFQQCEQRRSETWGIHMRRCFFHGQQRCILTLSFWNYCCCLCDRCELCSAQCSSTIFLHVPAVCSPMFWRYYGLYLVFRWNDFLY